MQAAEKTQVSDGVKPHHHKTLLAINVGIMIILIVTLRRKPDKNA